MRNCSRILSIYASDTSGVCSMLYELGGMTVVHDASGCNSTYSTHDEPRWYRQESMIYISALTEQDAILGNDEKFVADVTETALTLNPAFIALCGSPMPYMTGTDFDALGREITDRTGMKVFALHTNGMNSYLRGGAEALRCIVEHFADPVYPKTAKPSLNILGCTPLDFSLNGQVQSIRKFLEENGFEVLSVMAMDCTLEEIRKSPGAWCNLVVSSSGLDAARFMEKEFKIPYICGVPIGKEFSGKILEALRKGETAFPCTACRSASGEKKKDSGVIHEPIYASSLGCALSLEGGIPVRILSPLETEKELLVPGDNLIPYETDCLEIFGDLAELAADEMYFPIVPAGIRFIPLPHEAYSGRCYRKKIRNIIANNFTVKEFTIC